MTSLDTAEFLEPEMRECLRERGFQSLTPVQVKVLAPETLGHDLRVTSQTGSGKTVAIGLMLRQELRQLRLLDNLEDGPRALVVVPTRELAKQVHEELSWLYRPFGLSLACVTGGSNYRDERRALGRSPAVVVGTPGRLLDHVERGALRMNHVHSIVLDEADRMLDLGFSEAIEAIFEAAPQRERTHLVSATLEPPVLKLANRYQTAPLHVQGTRYGDAHADIEHRVYWVEPQHRLDALVNLLLLSPAERTLVFARTRADVGDIADGLAAAGFRAAALSGDMDQPARDRALAAFRQGRTSILVATDVAARGIDVQSLPVVIQVDPPTDPESYTHRSGRTGRAGQKGLSIVFVAPSRQRWFAGLLKQAHVEAKFLPLPSPNAIRKASDERLLNHLADELSGVEPKERWVALAQRLLEQREPALIVASLLEQTNRTRPEPRDVPTLAPDATERRKLGKPRQVRPSTALEPAPRLPPFGRPAPTARDDHEGWGLFHVTWGQLQGADARRMLAVVCRRGQIHGSDVGAIRIGPTTTFVEIRNCVAATFATHATRPDPQEPRIRIRQVEATESARPTRHPSHDLHDPQSFKSDNTVRGGRLPPPRKLKRLTRAYA